MSDVVGFNGSMLKILDMTKQKVIDIDSMRNTDIFLWNNGLR